MRIVGTTRARAVRTNNANNNPRHSPSPGALAGRRCIASAVRRWTRRARRLGPRRRHGWSDRGPGGSQSADPRDRGLGRFFFCNQYCSGHIGRRPQRTRLNNPGWVRSDPAGTDAAPPAGCADGRMIGVATNGTSSSLRRHPCRLFQSHQGKTLKFALRMNHLCPHTVKLGTR